MRSKVFRLFALLVILTMVVSPVAAKDTDGRAPADNTGSVSTTTGAASEEAVPAAADLPESPTGLYVVRLKDPSLSGYSGGIAGLAPTSPEATGTRKLDVTTAASQAYLSYLETQQQEAIRSVEATLGRSVEVKFQYMNVLNAFAVALDHAEALQIAALPGVTVYPDSIRELDTDVGPVLIGAPAIWDGDTASGVATQGEGVIIGVIDSGINFGHPSFDAVDGDGYTHVNPYGPGVYKGYCAANLGLCTDKLVGAYNYNPVGANPEDLDGHGSHTASTSGGNRHIAEFMVGNDSYEILIQGVAPRANIIAFKVCNPSCPGTASVAAVNQGIADGVDVFNYSISGSDSPWNDPVDLAFLDAFNAGAFVSASAGNAGPGPSTVAKTGPWNAAVAASTHNRAIVQTLDVTAPTTPPALQEIAVVPGEGTSITTDITGPLRYVAANNDGCTPFPPGSFTGALALIQRGGCTFAIKVDNAAAAGATGVVMFNSVGGPPITMGGLNGTPPAVMMDLASGIALRDYVVANPTTTTVRINAATSLVYIDEWEDIVAGFSSRGPSQYEILKPDYIAPGVNILAASLDSAGGYEFMQGTSMSSPHGAGAAALMIALNPTWGPAEIKSAMASTTEGGLFKEDGLTAADPFDVGSGRLALELASRAGLVFNETYANYVAANPALGGDPKTLNQPSVVSKDCAGECTWSRTVKSVADTALTYTASFTVPAGVTVSVTPSTFTIAPGATQVLEISADVTGAPLGSWSFASITLTPDTGSMVSAVLLSEDFTDPTFPPTGWSVHKLAGTGTTTWIRDTAQSLSPPASARRIYGGSADGNQDDWLVTPAIALESAVLSYFDRGQWMGDYGYSGVWISTGSCDPADNDFVELLETADIPITWRATPVVVDLGAYSGESACLAFRYSGDFAHTWWIDDVVVESVVPSTYTSIHLPVAVIPTTYTPAMTLDPAAMAAALGPDQTLTRNLTIGNTGGGNLEWEFVGAPVSSWVSGSSEFDRSNPQDGLPANQPFRLPAIAGMEAVPNLQEGFDDITVLPGWFMQNNSSPLGVTDWFQGNDTVFPSHSGAPTSYIGANFNSTANVGTISTWLVTPELDLENGKSISFWTRVPAGSTWPDRLEVRLSTSGASTNVGTLATDVGDFTTLLLSVNPGLTVGGYPDVWTEFTATLSGISEPATGRIAFRYYVTNGGPNGSNSNYIGIDTLLYGDPVVTECELPADVDWLDVAPLSGTVVPGGSQQVGFTFDSTGLELGTYEATLCIASNDPLKAFTEYPVTMEVSELPAIDVDPDALSASQDPDTVTTQTLTISNLGTGELVWDIVEAQAVALRLDGDALAAEEAIRVPVEASQMFSTAVEGLGPSVQTDPGITAAPIALMVDDGSAENALGLTNGGQFLWLNRFTPAPGDYPFNLEEVWLLFRSQDGINVGELVDVYIYQDADGNPANGATHVASFNNLAVQSITGTTWSVYDLAAPVTLSGPGDVLIAVVNRTAGVAAGTFPAAMDQTPPSQQRSWVGFGGVPGNPPVLPLATFGIVDSFGFAGNWMLRGYGTTITGCIPSDLPWLSVAPTSGMIPASGSTDVTVTFDSTGLASGTYTGKLCVNSNDPTNEVVEVPVTLVVAGDEPVIDVSPAALDFAIPTGGSDSDTLTISNLGMSDLIWNITEDPGPEALLTWNDNFDSYATGSQLHGQGGWKGWFNDPTAGALASSAQSVSAPNSAAILGASDLVHEYSGYTSGQWVYTAMQYVPSDFTGLSYFIILNTYTDSGTSLNWSVQIAFNGTSNLVLNDGGVSGGSLPLIRGQWVELRLEIDLDADLQSFYYNNQLLYTGTWSGQVSGGGAINIGAVDLFANNASVVYYDDMSLMPGSVIPDICEAPSDVPWLSAAPAAGTTPAGDSDDVTVTASTAGLEIGSYSANLCVASNDPVDPIVVVPVSLEVLAEVPAIEVAPEMLDFTVMQGVSGSETLVISNVGSADLVWEVGEEAPATRGLLTELLHDNGPFVTHPGAGPGGSDHSVLQNSTLGMITLGFGVQQSAGNRMADDFTVTDPNGWDVSQLRFYAYQTGSGTTSTITGLNYRIWDGPPNEPTSNIIFGDTTTNRLVATNWSNAYRVSQTTVDTNRPIMNVDASGGFHLPAGTYWVDWQFAGSLASGPWQPPITITGVTVTGNAMQYTSTGWAPANDTGTTPYQQGMPFLIHGVIADDPVCSTLGDVEWLSAAPASGTTPAGESDDVTVTADATGLELGSYSANLCVASNDPMKPLVVVPISLEVIEYVGWAPEAGFTFDYPVYEGVPVHFTNTTTGEGPITYAWDFGDGGTSTATNPTYTFAAAGAYTVTLTATNMWGDGVYEELVVVAPPLPGHADLSVAITVSPTPVQVGVETTFTAVVTNHGPDPVSGVVVSGDLPANIEFISGVNCSLDEGVLSCDLGTIEVDESKTAVVVLKFTAAGSFEISLDVIGDLDDPVPGNNAGTVTIEVTQPAVQEYWIYAPIIRRGQ
jgi:uncharacterized repeat protein (TIGR01451 family)